MSKTWEQCLAYDQGKNKRTGNVEILIKEAVNQLMEKYFHLDW